MTAFAVLESLTQIAIGLENGIVLLLRGDLTRDRSIKSRVVHEGSESITGLGFCLEDANTTLFIVTLARILSYNTQARDPPVPCLP